MSLPKIGAAIVLDGEKEYKDAIAKVNRSMSEMRSEMKLVTAQFDGQANAIEALRKKHDVLKKEYEAQETKLRTMTGALENAKKQYGENSKEASEWQIKINNATAELAKLDKELKQNEKYMEEAEKSTDGTAKSIDEYGKEVKEAENKTLSFGDVLKANLASEAIVAGVKAMGSALKGVGESALNAVKETAAYADEVLTMSNNTGIATDTLQELMYMQELTDVSVETVTSTMAKQIKSMANAQKGTEDYVNAYELLNVEIEDANGKLRDGEVVYWDVIDALGKMENETERDAVAMQLLGRSAQDVNSIVKIGSAGVKEFAQEARDMGAVLDEEALNTLGATDDAFQRMNESLGILQRELGLAMAPTVTESIEKVTDKLSEMKEPLSDMASGALDVLTDSLCWVMDNGGAIVSVLSGIAAGFVAMKAIAGIQAAVSAFTAMSTAVTTAGGAVSGLWTIISAHPIGAAVTAVGALTAAVVALAMKSNDASDATREAIDKRTESRREMEAEAVVCQQLVEELKELQAKTSLTADEQSRQKDIISQLNSIMPDLNLAIDEQTGLLNMNIEALEGNVEALMALSRAEAAKEALTENASEQVEKQKELNDLLKQQEETEQRLASLKSQSSKSSYGIERRGSEYNTRAIIEAEKQLRVLDESIANAESSLELLQAEYRETMDYISSQEALADAASDMASLKTETEGTNQAIKLTGDALEEHLDAFSEKMQELLDEQYDDYEDSLEKQVNALKDSYEDKLDLMEKEQKKERKMLEKQQKDELELFEAKYDALLALAEKKYAEETKAAKKAHDERIALIDYEFTERMKLADEERYKQVKAAQEQIDEIKRIIEEEELAEQAKTEAKKRAELEKAITQAETIEEKKAAEQELAEFEEELRQEALNAERAAAIEALEAQIEAYNNEYEEFVDKEEKELQKQKETAEEELKVEEERIAAVLQAEKERIKEEMEAEKEAIQERHELQDEELAERYENKRKSLQAEKELAIETEKEINAELLSQFKKLNADKLEEAKATAEELYRHNAELVESLNLDQYVTTAPSTAPSTNNHVVNNSPVFNTNVSNWVDLESFFDRVNRVLAMEY